MAILLASSELDEVRSTSDRILVLSRGALTAEFPAQSATDDALMTAASAGGERRTAA
jgi:ABC-type sugar transport system ATPase subunit